MFKIAILGCENSHADAFLKILKENKYPDVEVVGVYSNEPEAAAKLNTTFGVYVANSYDEFVGKVDGIMITARDGKYHYEYAKPYIAAGIPMFIDKPVTTCEAEAYEFMKALKDSGTRITGGSSCIHCDYVKELSEIVKNQTNGKVYGGYLRAPVSMTNNYGNYYFYAAHLIQITQEIFGYYPVSVKANVSGKVNSVVIRYNDYDVTATYVDGNYVYYASVSAEKSVVGSAFPVDSRIFASEFDEFYKLLTGEEQRLSYNDFISPVSVMCAVERSINSGNEEKVNYCEQI